MNIYCKTLLLTSLLNILPLGKAWLGHAQNPYLPLGEFIPDGEPYVFDDPDCPGKHRVYIYGSHDVLKTAYCGKDQVVWSASTDDLTHWRYDGVILESKKDANGNLLHEDGTGDVLFAPDIAFKKTSHLNGRLGGYYYLYPNNQAGGRQGMVCKSDRPDGPFVPCNWDPKDPKKCDGVLRFDPGVFVDDDGRAYAYWGFNDSYGAELDTTTMATVKPGTDIIRLIPGKNETTTTTATSYVGDFEAFRFFEASSIRKIKDKYVLIYSRWTKDGDFGMPETNYTLAYCYSNNPLGPFTYGGTIIDGRALEPFPTPIKEIALSKNSPLPTPNSSLLTSFTACPTGNTHGSICCINGQWYVFYHRQSGTCEYHRQAMVAPITVDVKEGPDGYVKISQAEYTSEGFQTDGLDPYQQYPAGIACYYTGPERAYQKYPNVIYSGSHPDAIYADYTPFTHQRGTTDEADAQGDPYSPSTNQCPMVNNTDGSVIGYKYFNLSKTNGNKKLSLLLDYTPEGTPGTIDVFLDRPTVEQGGKKLGTIKVSSTAVDGVTGASNLSATAATAAVPEVSTTAKVNMKSLASLTGKHALFLVIHSDTKGKSICKLNTLQFK